MATSCSLFNARRHDTNDLLQHGDKVMYVVFHNVLFLQRCRTKMLSHSKPLSKGAETLDKTGRGEPVVLLGLLSLYIGHDEDYSRTTI
jgi:hypothetical protein